GISNVIDGVPATRGDTGSTATDTDGDSVADYRDLDSDNDSINDVDEAGNGTLDTNDDGIINAGDGATDADGDGISSTVDGSGTRGDTPSTLTDGDSDGTPDFRELDSDNDGNFDIDEKTCGTANCSFLDLDGDNKVDGAVDADGDGIIGLADGAPSTFGDLNDTDRDGVADNIDIDSDNDGIPNSIEGGTSADQDGDGIPNYLDLDSDNDGIADVVEAGGVDANGDGRADFVEANADVADNDNDGLIDNIDVNPAVISADAGSSSELTALTGAGGYYYPSGSPRALDTDGDGVPDFLDLDSDNDSVLDVAEARNTDANNDGRVDFAGAFGVNDTDGDGWLNAFDSDNGGTAKITSSGTAGSAPTGYVGTGLTGDGDSVPDFRDLDADNDGIDDIRENNGVDGDNDGVIGTGTPTVNGDGVSAGATSTMQDTDSDGVADVRDLDSDNDGIDDTIEGGNGASDTNNDGVINSSDTGGADTDGDGISNSVDGSGSFGDGVGGNTARDQDSDSVPDFRDLDSDNDGINDTIEGGNGALDTNNDGIIDAGDGATDTDGDGISSTVDGSGAFGDGVGGSTATDTDGDSVPDFRDLDSDNDSINDVDEAGNGAFDTNDDGMINTTDGATDADGDGISSTVDGSVTRGDTPSTLTDGDSDGTPDFRELDSDNDGNFDIDEKTCGTANCSFLDLDGDNKVDGAVDTDGDGIIGNADGSPLTVGDLNDADRDGIADALDIDADNDGIPNSIEGGTSADQDGDGIPNYLDLDADNDGIADVIEAGGLDTNGDGRIDFSEANADLADADNDGLIDNIDINPAAASADSGASSELTALTGSGGFYYGGGAPRALDTDSDGVPDFLDLDADNDGTYDVDEAGGTDANNDGRVDFAGGFGVVDTDGDGWIDTFDGSNGGTPSITSTGTVGSAPTGYAGTGVTPDGDMNPNFRDLDSDNDGINDVRENNVPDPDNDGLIGSGTPTVNSDGVASGVVFVLQDRDGDGVPDMRDLDSDNDGINDVREGVNPSADTNNDGVINSSDTGGADTDGDGISDSIDQSIGTYGDLGDPAIKDTDGDGVPDFRDLDADNDGINDVIEGGNTASDTNNDGVLDGVDADGDGIKDGVDTNIGSFGENPNGSTAPDADGDSVPDFRDLDSDNDGINDVIEGNSGPLDTNNDGTINSSDTGGADADGDGIPDSTDGGAGSYGDGTSSVPVDTDGDGVADFRDLDSDNDSINDVIEGGNGGNDANNDGLVDGTDPDGDGIRSSVDTNPAGFAENPGGSVTPVDTDNNGIPDYRDLDSDNDGINDIDEACGSAGCSALDLDNDGDVDGSADADRDGILDAPDSNDSAFGEPVAGLPLNFLSFKATEQGDKVRLEWSTGNEYDNDHFKVEHALDGVNFTTIGKVAGRNLTAQVSVYDFVHEQPANGLNYYRITQVDRDGTSTSTSVVSIDMSKFEVVVYPNPARQASNLKLNSEKAESVQMQMLNAQGVVVFSQKIQKDKGEQIVKLPMQELPAGVYIIKMQVGTRSFIQKLVKE
ncbi:MAG: T9SS C-terminal target domain-containing protein, partial [Bacteroidetes bacterium]